MSVRVEDLWFRYERAPSPALDRLSLEVREKAFISITGPSGGGKSTLALAVSGFIPHSYAGEMSGRVVTGGMDTKFFTPVALSGTIGLVRQDPDAQLCTLSVLDEVSFGPENLRLSPREVSQRVQWALEVCGVSHLAEREVYTLSGGEKQRVAIASILAMKPRIMILDEPTANLDPDGTKEVLTSLFSLRNLSGSTIIVIEHRLRRLLPLSDEVIVIDGGRVAYRGNRSDLAMLQPRPAAVRDYTDLPEYRCCETHKSFHHYSFANMNLSVRHLKVKYGDKEVLKDVTFDIAPGKLVALLGDNGSGKSTLLAAIMGLVQPAAGTIAFQGRDTASAGPQKRAKFAGMSFQNPNHQISESTVARELSLTGEGLGRKPIRELDPLLAEFGLKDCLDRSPFSLSMGQKKRLNMISILSYGQKLLLLDEPFTGQDPAMVVTLIHKLKEFCREGGSVLMVCHEPEIVDICCSRIMFLENGNIIIDRPKNEAFKCLAEKGRFEYLPEPESETP